jgi:hypothetical protein
MTAAIRDVRSRKASFFKLVFKRADSPHGRRIGGFAEGFANQPKGKMPGSCGKVCGINIPYERAALSTNGAEP